MNKNFFVQIGNTIINKSKITSVNVKKYNEDDTYCADIIVHYNSDKKSEREVINISVFYLPESCDPKGRICDGLEEVEREYCLKCDGAKEVKRAAYKEFNRLLNEKIEEIRVLLGVDIINEDESTSFSLTENGTVKQ